MDKIIIKDLEIFANHGVLKEEQILGQKFLISIVLYTDTKEAGMTDNLTSSIHYGEVCEFVQEFVKNHTFLLIERVAETLTEELLLQLPLLEKVEMQLKKPWAPVRMPVAYVAVEILRGWNRVYLSLGSNVGERADNLQGAVDALSKHRKCQVERVTKTIETKPYGGVPQKDYLNSCVQLRTLLTPRELLAEIHLIERAFGRQREDEIRLGPRTLDIDIIFYENKIITEEGLTIPHREMHKRSFVLEPLCEIAPFYRHPIYGKTVQDMWDELQD